MNWGSLAGYFAQGHKVVIEVLVRLCSQLGPAREESASWLIPSVGTFHFLWLNDGAKALLVAVGCSLVLEA